MNIFILKKITEYLFCSLEKLKTITYNILNFRKKYSNTPDCLINLMFDDFPRRT